MEDVKDVGEKLKCCVKDINQANESDVYISQKNITILYFDASGESGSNLKPLEKVLGEELNLEIDEEGNVRLNTDKMEIKEFEDGSKAFILEKEDIKTGEEV